MFCIIQLDHVVLRVSDLQLMLDFYQRVLGCTLERQETDLGLYQLRAGSSLIGSAFGPTRRQSPRPRRAQYGSFMFTY